MCVVVKHITDDSGNNERTEGLSTQASKLNDAVGYCVNNMVHVCNKVQLSQSNPHLSCFANS